MARPGPLPSVCGLFNAAMFLSGFPLINYLPRFFLAGLLIFAGAGFIVENLFDARSTLSPAVRDDLLLCTAACDPSIGYYVE